MRTTRVIVAAGVLALALWPGRGEAQVPKVPTIEEIAARWQQRQDASKTFRIEWTQAVFYPKGACSTAAPKDFDPGQVFPPADVTHDERGLLVMDGGKARLEQTEKLLNTYTKSFTDSQSQTVYDGKTGSMLVDVGGDHKRMTRESTPTSRLLVTTDTKPALLTFRPLRVDTGGLDLDLFRVTGRTAGVNGVRCVEVAAVSNTPTAGSTLWLDPTRDDHIVRVQQTGAGRYGLIQYDIDYVADGPGRWRPAGWVSVFQLRGGQLHKRVKATVTACSVGGAAPAGTFSTDPPPNTRVEDYSDTGQTTEFVVRPDGSRREVLPGERSEKYDILVRTEPGEPLGRPVRSWWGRNWMWVMGGVAILAGLAGLVVRRRRS